MERIKGLKELLKKLDSISEDAQKEINVLAETNTRDIALKAVQRAPVDKGKLRQSIQFKELPNNIYAVEVGESYAPFVEFGTGPQVQVPAELSSFAQQYQGGGIGTFEKGLESIRDWCRAKGIEEKAAYPIFISILKNGMRAQPFLYPSFVEGRINFLNDVNDYLKEITK